MNLLTLPTHEAERIAYAEGDTRTAELLARIAELEAERDALERELDEAREDSLTRWENKNGPADEYKQFFFECFERLAKRYPGPSVTFDHDKSVIFEAIMRGAE